jgi:hypothetical protein
MLQFFMPLQLCHRTKTCSKLASPVEFDGGDDAPACFRCSATAAVEIAPASTTASMLWLKKPPNRPAPTSLCVLKNILPEYMLTI